MMEAQLIIGSVLQRMVPKLSGDGHVRRQAQLSMHPMGGLPTEVILKDGVGAPENAS
jgi:hypothetical protein